MAVVGNFDESSASRIGRVVRRIEAEINGAQDDNGKSRFDDGWRAFKNSSGETIPRYGLFRIHDVDVTTPEVYQRVAKKPDTTFSRLYAVNSSMEVGNGELGLCRTFGEVMVAYDSGSPALLEGWGAKPSQFTASQYFLDCLIVEKILDSTNKIMLARLSPISSGLGKANATIANGASGDISIWYGDFTGDITGMDLGMHNEGPSVASGDKVAWEYKNGTPIFVKLCS